MIFKLLYFSGFWYRMVQVIITALSHCGIATHARRHRERGASRGGKEFFAVVHIVELLPLEHELKLLVAFLDLKFHRKLIRNDLDEVAHPERVVVVVMVLVVHKNLVPGLTLRMSVSWYKEQFAGTSLTLTFPLELTRA